MQSIGVTIRRHARTVALGALIACLAGCAGGGETVKKSAMPEGTFAFWPPFPEEPRVQFVASFTTSEDVKETEVSGLEKLVFGKEAIRGAAILKPYGVAMRDAKIYVTDMRGRALVVLDLRAKQTRLVGVSGINRLEHPVAVAVADDGTIYVADNERGAIFVYDANERFSQLFGFPNFKPVAIAVGKDRLYAADRTGQNVVIFDRASGKKLGTIGTVGDGDGQFRLPIGVAVDRAGDVYVMDMMRCCIQKFSPDGAFISGAGQLGDYAGAFVRPKHIAVDGDGYLYVVDAAFQNVQMFNDQYHTLMHFGAAGDFPGAMSLPAGVAVSDEGLDVFKDKFHPGFAPKRLIAVTNQFGPTRVVVYALGERRPGYTNEQLATSALTLPSGTGQPTPEQMRMRNPGGVELLESETGPGPLTPPKPGDGGAAAPPPAKPAGGA